MKIKLIKTIEPDGKWYKVIAGDGGWPLKVYSYTDETETTVSAKAFIFFLDAIERAKMMNIETLTSIEI